MQDSGDLYIPSEQSTVEKRLSINIHLLLWEERIIAEESGDERMQTLTQQSFDFYEWIGQRCFYLFDETNGRTKKELGKFLVKASNFRLGKGWLSRSIGVSPLEAQKLLNKYYGLFKRIKDWVKDVESPEKYVADIISGVINTASMKCKANLPSEWGYEDAFRYSAPSYSDSVQIEKFFKHFYETEILIDEKMVHLPVAVEIV